MHQRMLRNITDFIFMNDTPQPSDVILIPGTSKSAITERAAELYCAGMAKYVLPSGRFSANVGRFAKEKIDNPRYYGDYATDFAYCRHILIHNGVPEDVILREDRAMQSMENAAFSAGVLKTLGIPVARAILCCQAFHARRAFMSYARYFPATEIMVVPVDTQEITAENWYLSEKGYRKVMGEVEKCGKYFMDYDLELHHSAERE